MSAWLALELSARFTVLVCTGWSGYTRLLMVTVPSSLARRYSGSLGTAGGSGLHVMSATNNV